ncbi:hypothetical protein [Aestuariivivens sediminicola]|uniref:hypothetical protein n=1 Tax=Aestuariivivens sediminicola TaxID=2913560 RepID=UPI001F56A14F|nr:hypothetical protein [Aestuariivivens sediminicola]
MKAGLCIFILLLFSKATCQDIVVETGFTVRDFEIIENTLLYIEKRHIKNFNFKSKQRDSLINSEGFFIGGYGLRLYPFLDQDLIVTASNELVKDRSSIRFYNVSTKSINKYHVYYTTELMDFEIAPKDSLFFLSKKDKQIAIFKYGDVPRYNKIDSLNLDSYCRKLKYHKENLYGITDSGTIFSYNVKTKVKKRVYHGNSLLVNFTFDKQHENMFVTTFNGDLIKVNINGNAQNKTIHIGKDIIEAIAIYEDKYILTGDWNGQIKLIDIQNLSLIKAWNNKKRIVKILSGEQCFYTSSADRTIKKWKIDQK